MNYKESEEILSKVQSADRILVNCHRNPDPDSVGSALAMYSVLRTMGKDVAVICPTGASENLSFLKNFEAIETVDFEKYDFSQHDLFICIDSASWGMVAASEDIKKPNIDIVVIDHHKTNTKYGSANLVDWEVNSAAEVLYRVFEDWEVTIDEAVATSLLTGIIGDTGSFRYSGTTPETLRLAANLLEKGADKDKINLNINFTVSEKLVAFWAEMLSRIKIENEHSFVWVAAPFELYKKFGKPVDAKERLASEFFQSVEGTNFGVVMVETEEKNLSVSFRSRTNFDVSKIAIELGGGGHAAASGARIENTPYEEAVEKVLETCRKYAK